MMLNAVYVAGQEIWLMSIEHSREEHIILVFVVEPFTKIKD